MIKRDGKPVYRELPLNKEKFSDESKSIELSEGAYFVEFVTSDDRVHGFAYSQLVNYTLEKVEDDAGDDRLTLVFNTHEVTLTGWRLRDLLRLLREGKVGAVKTGDARYANLHQEMPFVTEIKISAMSLQP